MNQEIKKKWLEALRSGKYKQGAGYLRRRDESYCCLGVLCDIVEPENWEENHLMNDTAWFHAGQTEQMNPAVRRECEITFNQAWTLMSMNDRGNTFNNIANWIETNL